MMFKSGENSNIRLRAANFYNQCKIYNQRHPLLCVILTILFLVFFLVYLHMCMDNLTILHYQNWFIQGPAEKPDDF